MVNVSEGFERVEKPSKGLTISGFAGLVLTDLLHLPAFAGQFFGRLTGLGLLGRGIGYTGRKVSE